MADDEAAEFAAFVQSHARQLQRAAWLLTGDWGTAQDLVQAALIKTWQRWAAIRVPDARGAYARRVLMSTFLSWRRRRRAGETSLGSVPDRASGRDEEREVAESVAVLTALKQLPPHQRAVVVLRYFDDLTEQAAAQALGCSVGTVKSQHARALRTLRTDPNLQGLFVEGNS
jgi:RNA polymerase sigma-70 factor (sigma-E family)